MSRTRYRAAFTLVEIMIVVAIIGLLAAIAIPNFLKARLTAQQNVCVENLTKIQAAKQMWGAEKNKGGSAIASATDLFGPDAYLKENPLCPAGGTYGYGPLTSNPTCTITNHVYAE